MSLSKAEYKASEKNDYEILFKDCSEYFVVKNAKMIQEGALIRFICFDTPFPIALVTDDQYYPIANIHRIKRYNRSFKPEQKPEEKNDQHV